MKQVGYAPAKAVYQVLRSALAPWTRSHGFRRWPGTQAGWQKALGTGQLLGFKFEGYILVNPDTGTSLGGLVQLESSNGSIPEMIRQAPISCCLVPSELDRFLGGRVAKPIDTTPPHLRPTWLDSSSP